MKLEEKDFALVTVVGMKTLWNHYPKLERVSGWKFEKVIQGTGLTTAFFYFNSKGDVLMVMPQTTKFGRDYHKVFHDGVDSNFEKGVVYVPVTYEEDLRKFTESI